MRLRSGERVLFIGDSITECCRQRVEPPLGAGYVQFVHLFLAARHPHVQVELLNRGVDGDTVRDLAARWERDVIAERPDWLFVMIGVNDELFAYSAEYADRAVDLNEYRAIYRRLLARTRAALDLRIVLMDPTPLEEDLTSASHDSMRARVAVVAELAREFATERIATFDRLHRAIERSPRRGWMIDVPHPRLEGQAVIALAVLEHLGWDRDAEGGT